MSKKKDLKQEELNKVFGGTTYGRQVDINQSNGTEPVDTNFKPEDVGAIIAGEGEEGTEILIDMATRSRI